jgi:hypothetical protein
VDEDDQQDHFESEQPQKSPELIALEQEARSRGHTTKDEWVSSGRDPELWKSAREYVEYGKIKEALEQKSQDFDRRIESLNKLHQTQLEKQRQELLSKQRDSVLEADTETYDKIQQQLDDIDKTRPAQPQPQQPKKDTAILEWEQRNPWSQNASDPRLHIANGLFQGYMASNPHANVSAALQYVDSQMAASAPAQQRQNPRRSAPNQHERGTPSQRSGGKITFSDLSPEERDMWNRAGQDIWGGDKKLFLQSVADSRRK